jgi:amino acid adenylation domain-containing protein
MTSGPASDAIMLPASFAQELLWLTDRASPGSTAYNVPRTRRLRGRLDVAALRRAFDALAERHEILRTTYATHDDQAVQVVHAPRAVPFDVVDLSATPIDARQAELTRIVRERSARPFDLANDLLMRVTLLRLDDEDHVLLFESHHIAFDGWSRDIVFRELSAFYEAFAAGTEPALPVLPIQYADFAIWQREQLQGERLASLMEWWRNELGDAEHVLQLPTDFPRRTVSRYEGVSRSLRLPPETRDAIGQLARRYDATMYMVVLAAYTTVLHRYTGQPDVLVGSPIAGRAQSESEGLIGYFANTIVQRARFAGDPTFAELLTRLRTSALGAYDHQDVPFEKLVLELEGRTALGHSPLFQVVLTQLDSSQAPDARLGDVRLESFALDNETTKFDLTLFMSESAAGLNLMLRGRADLHHAASLERFLGHVASVLTAAVASAETRVSEIALATEAERDQLAAWNATAVDEGTPATLTELFARQVARVPERVAIVAGGGAITYKELNERANQLAHALRARGVGPGVPAGLLLDRSADALVGLLGILKSGGAYLPLSVDAPPARLAHQIALSEVRVVVTSEALVERLPAGTMSVALDRDAAELSAQPASAVDVAIAPDDVAYVLFTSGSTGVPKGVAVTHANAVHYARAASRVLGDVPATQAGDGFAALDGLHFALASTLAADLGNTSLLPALLSGGTLHVLASDVTTEPARFADYLRHNQIDVIKLTPNHLAALAAGKTGRELAGVLPRRWLVLGGEALRPELARVLSSAGGCRVLNHYGPTETTVGVCTFEVTTGSLEAVLAEGAQTIPVGYPLANTHAYVVSARGVEQPIGIPGELWLGGAGVAQGYHGQPELTRERFVDFNGERVYRTGDRVRRLADGTIEFLGRADDQVKVRGYRVELGEVEQVLRAHPAVSQSVVLLRRDGDAEPALIAYAVVVNEGYAVSHGDRATPESLTNWMSAQLPSYMVPSAVVLLDAMPLTANGKIDASKLPAPDAGTPADAYTAPRNHTEEQLCKIWMEVLKKERIGVTDNFLDLGGHSLLAIRMLGKISKTFGVRLPLRTLFDAPTVTELGEIVELEVKLKALESMSEEDAARLLAGNGAAQDPSA